MSRLGRSQPVQPTAWHGFVDPGPGPVGTTPPQVTVVPLVDERRRQQPALTPVVLSGVLAPVSAPAVFPPAPVVVAAERQRGVFLQPTVAHGLDEAAPPAPTVAEPDDRRRRSRPALDPVTLSGAFSVAPAPPAAAPPPPVNVDRADQRGRFKTPDPVALSGALFVTPVAPTAVPPAPFVVPLEERRRFLAALPPTVSAGFDDVVPPAANVVGPDGRPRQRPHDPTFLSGATLGATPAPAAVPPPGPFVVPIEERRRLLALRPATSSHGFVDPGPGPVGTTPPPVTSIDRVDQRVRYLPQSSLVFSGVLAPPETPPAPNVGTVQDMTPFIVGQF